MSSMTTSDFLRVFTTAKHELNLKYEMKRVYQVKQSSRKRHKLMEDNMKKMGKKIPEEQKFNVNKLVDNLKDFKWHTMSKEKVLQQLKTNERKGLTQQQVEERMRKEGQNTLKQVKQTHWVLIFLSQMSDPFSLFIWFIIILAFIGYPLLNDSNQLLLAILLIVTIVSGAIISYGFARSSSEDIQDFRQFFPRFSNVIRDGQLKLVKSKQLVPGDIIVFNAGDLVPADIRVIKSNGMKINRATFTGESQPVQIILQNEQDKEGFQKMDGAARNNKKTMETAQQSRSRPYNPLEAPNMIFSGCVNVEGEGTGVVIQTGDKMLIASIRDILTNFQGKTSYLQKQIGRFVKIITIFCLCIGIYTFVGGWIIGFPIVIAADIAIGVICASCPGILNLELTCILYISVKRLIKRGMICKSLVAVETLGSTQILCTDKTGTLTTNKMTFEKLFYNNQVYKATNFENYSRHYKHEYDIEDPTFKELHKCAVLSSVADFNKSLPKDSITKISSRRDILTSQKQLRIKQMQKQWEQSFQHLKYQDRQVTGNPVQSAILRFFQPIADIKQTRFRFQLTRNIAQNKDNKVPFNSQSKYSLSINHSKNDDDYYTVYLKGAPQVVWRMCDFVMIHGEKVSKNNQNQRVYHQTVKSWGTEGRRLLGFCCLTLNKSKKEKNEKIITPERFIQQRGLKLKGMTFLGAVSMQDPPRKGIAETMLKIRRAGIKIIVITGDQQQTAVSIARQCNIFTHEQTTSQIMQEDGVSFQEAFVRSNNVVVNGQQLMKIISEDEMKPEFQKGKQLHKIIQKPNIIFARTNPSQKLYIVEMLQKLGYVVTVTGDGVNDSPAIKVANTGISMGSGSDASRDAADIIIGNDDLNNIIIGIQQGRRLFDNFKKAICYVMTSQVSQWMPFVFLILTQIPIPIFTLLVDGAVDFVPTLAFAYQESEEGIMTRPPKYKDERLVNFRLIAQCQGWMGFSSFLCCLFAYYIIMVDFGFVPSDLWGKSNDFILLQNKWDNYNPTSRYLGNSNLESIASCSQFDSIKVRVDWINTSYPSTDLRMSAVRCSQQNGQIVFKQYFKFGQCRMQQISIYTFKPICYTPQAAKYGQSSYMFANVINQVFNWIICRTRRDSAITKRFNNPFFVFALGVQAMMGFSLGYSTPWIWMIGTRDVAFQHFGISAIPFAIVQLTMDQIRKFLIRNLPSDKNGRPNWFARNTLW